MTSVILNKTELGDGVVLTHEIDSYKSTLYANTNQKSYWRYFRVKISLRKNALLEYPHLFDPQNTDDPTLYSNLFYQFFLTAFQHHTQPIENLHTGRGALFYLDAGRHGHFNFDIMETIQNSTLTDLEKVYSFIFGRYYGLPAEEAIAKGRGFAAFAITLDLTQEENIAPFIDPINAQYGKTLYPLLARISKHLNNSDSIQARFKDQKYSDFVYRLWTLLCMENISKNEPISELVLGERATKAENDSENLNFIALPIQTEKYRQYLGEKTLKEVAVLIGKIPSGTAASTAIAMSEKILTEVEQPETNPLQLPSDTLISVLPKLVAFKDAQLMSTLTQCLLLDIKRTETFALLKDYFESVESSTLTKELVLEINSCLLGVDVKNWIVGGTKFSEHTISVLRKTLTPGGIIAAILAVAKEKPLTGGQWQLYSDNHEIYKDSPASWWITLVKRLK